jgi:hypothetical protein
MIIKSHALFAFSHFCVLHCVCVCRRHTSRHIYEPMHEHQMNYGGGTTENNIFAFHLPHPERQRTQKRFRIIAPAAALSSASRVVNIEI